jgi:hypothetical protein
VLKQAKGRRNHLIQTANRIMNDFLKIMASNPGNTKMTTSYSSKGTIKAINNIYSNFFEEVEKGRENITLRLFIYSYKSICKTNYNDITAEKKFRDVLPSLHSSSKALWFIKRTTG